MLTTGTFSPSGRYYYGLTRWSTSIFRIDTSSGDVTGVTPVAAGTAAGTCIYTGADGFAYAGFQLGSHRQNAGNGIAVSRIDLASMTALATTSLYGETNEEASSCAYRGQRLALGYGRGAYFFNTTTMAFEDTVPGTTVIDGVVLTNRARTLAFNQAGTILYAAGGREPLIQKVDAAFAVTTYHTATAGRVYTLTTDAADVLWFGADTGLFSFDGTTETQVPALTTRVGAIAEITGTTAKVVGTGEIYTIDVTTGAQTSNSSLPTTDKIGHHAAWVK